MAIFGLIWTQFRS